MIPVLGWLSYRLLLFILFRYLSRVFWLRGSRYLLSLHINLLWCLDLSLLHRLTGLSSLLLLLNVFSGFFGFNFTGLSFHIFLLLTLNLFIDNSGYHFGLTWCLLLLTSHLLSLSFDWRLLLFNIFYLMLSFFYRFFGGNQVCLRGWWRHLLMKIFCFLCVTWLLSGFFNVF
jgi:hypothetical protein